MATEAGRLSAETVSALADEASGPRGSFLPLPADGDDPTLAAMRSDVRGASGSLLFVEAGDQDVVQGGGGNRANYRVERFGADPPEALVDLARRASSEVFAACGLSASLFADQQGATPREAYRQAIVGTVVPLAKLAIAELRRALDAPTLELFVRRVASDITRGR